MTGYVEIPTIDHVQQKIVDAKNGDCFQACVASLLRIPLEEVPTFHEHLRDTVPIGGWNWLLTHKRIWIDYTHRMEDGSYRRTPDDTGIPPGYTIASVPSALFPDTWHAVVALDGKVVWDPSPHAAQRTLPYDPIRSYIRLYWYDFP